MKEVVEEEVLKEVVLMTHTPDTVHYMVMGVQGKVLDTWANIDTTECFYGLILIQDMHQNNVGVSGFNQMVKIVKLPLIMGGKKLFLRPRGSKKSCSFITSGRLEKILWQTKYMKNKRKINGLACLRKQRLCARNSI